MARNLLEEESQVNQRGITVSMCQMTLRVVRSAGTILWKTLHIRAGIVSSPARSSAAWPGAREICLDLQAQDCQQVLDAQTEDQRLLQMFQHKRV